MAQKTQHGGGRSYFFRYGHDTAHDHRFLETTSRFAKEYYWSEILSRYFAIRVRINMYGIIIIGNA